MKEAKDFFEDLGYMETRNDEDYVVYSKEIKKGVFKNVTFSRQHESFVVEFEGVDMEVAPMIDMKLMQVIYKKVQELGWV